MDHRLILFVIALVLIAGLFILLRNRKPPSNGGTGSGGLGGSAPRHTNRH